MAGYHLQLPNNQEITVSRSQWNAMEAAIKSIPGDFETMKGPWTQNVKAHVIYVFYGLLQDYFRRSAGQWKPLSQKTKAYWWNKPPTEQESNKAIVRDYATGARQSSGGRSGTRDIPPLRQGKGFMPMNLPGGPKVHASFGRLPRGTGELSGTVVFSAGRTLRQRKRYANRELVLPGSDLAYWWQLYKKRLFKLMLSGKGMSYVKASPVAAAFAWRVVKGRGSETKLNTIGSRGIQPGFATGRLLRAMSQGTLGGSPGARKYIPPNDKDGGPVDQHTGEESDESPNVWLVGPSAYYARWFHRGWQRGSGGCPPRPIMPDQIPESWMQEIAQAAATATLEFIQRMKDAQSEMEGMRYPHKGE